MSTSEDTPAEQGASPSTSKPSPAISKPTYSFSTTRLHIRSPLTRDVPFLLHLMTNPANHTYEIIQPDLSLKVYDERVREWHEKSEKGDQAFFVICLKPETGKSADEDTPIGFSGYHAFELSGGNQSDGSSLPVRCKSYTGVMIDAPRFIQKGYAVEALQAVLEFGFAARSSTPGEGLDIDEIEIGTLAENEPFQNVMRKMGLMDLGVEGIGGDVFEPHRGKKVVTWNITRPVWQEKFGEGTGYAEKPKFYKMGL